MFLGKTQPLWSFMAQQILEKLLCQTDPSSKSQIKEKNSSLTLTPIEVAGYEQVIEVTDSAVGLSAFIAIHDTTLGPALGGIRILPYAKKEEALEDVLRLSKGMTYKASVAGVGFGGGKSVIIADPKTEKTPELLKAFAAAVDRLNGIYICAEDVGTTTEDVQIIESVTPYVVGLASENGSGNPAYFTAWGVFRGVQSVIKELFGTESVEGKKVAIQGTGSVGSILADYLFWAGAELIVSDIDPASAKRCAKKTGATVVSPEEILKVSCDVFAPCALGGVLNSKTIPHLRCAGIAGATNNQLLSDSDMDLLDKQGILYAPDFVINAGGLLNVSFEIDSAGYDPRVSRAKCHSIYDTLLTIYAVAKEKKISTHKAALFVAEDRIRKKMGKRASPPVFRHRAEMR